MLTYYNYSLDIDVATEGLQKFVQGLLDDNKKIFGLYFMITSTVDYRTFVKTLKIKLPDITCFGTMTNAVITGDATILSGFAVFAFTDDIIEDMLITNVTYKNTSIVKRKIKKHFNLKSSSEINDKEYISMLVTDFEAFCDETICMSLKTLLPNSNCIGGIGSNGYGMAKDTKIFINGKFLNKAGLIAIMKPKVKFYKYKIRPVEIMTHTRAQITSFDVDTRTIKTVNNRPVAEYYCDVVNLDTKHINAIDILADYIQNFPIALENEYSDYEIQMYDVLNINKEDMSFQLTNTFKKDVMNIYCATFDDINMKIKNKLFSFLDNRKEFYCLCFSSFSIFNHLFRTREILDTLKLIEGSNLLIQVCFGEYYNKPVNHTITLILFDKPI